MPFLPTTLGVPVAGKKPDSLDDKQFAQRAKPGRMEGAGLRQQDHWPRSGSVPIPVEWHFGVPHWCACAATGQAADHQLNKRMYPLGDIEAMLAEA